MREVAHGEMSGLMRPSSPSFDANRIGSGRMRPSAVLDVDRPEQPCCRLLCTTKGRVLLRYAAYTLSKRATRLDDDHERDIVLEY